MKCYTLGNCHPLAGPLMHIINTCIAALVFSRVWKAARVSPIPKIDQPIDKSDFRPVSILPTLSKIYERLVLSQLASHIDEQSLLGVRISGYISIRSFHLHCFNRYPRRFNTGHEKRRSHNDGMCRLFKGLRHSTV